jgi:hypothetical protein
MAGYGASRGGLQIIGGFWLYAGIMEYLQHFVSLIAHLVPRPGSTISSALWVSSRQPGDVRHSSV